MQQQINSQIEGEFTGYNDGAIFKLTNGQVWQQSVYKYKYHYAYRPKVRIYPSGSGSYFMEVDGVNDPVVVQQVTLASEGQIKSDFNGYKQGEKFQFQNGQTWEQTENKYVYHYAHMPHAVVIDGINGFQIQVDGMEESVKVRRI